MLGLENLLQDGYPALLIMLGAVLILVFLRLIVPRLIKKLQKKKPLLK